MDELDEKLIKLLQTNGRATNARLAREADVSEGTVRRRLRHLVQDGLVNVIAVPRLERMGFNTTFLVGIQCAPGLLDEAAGRLAALPEIHLVALTTGSYDIFIWGAVGSPEELSQFLRSKLGSIPGVMRAETFINLSIRKRTYGLAR